MSANFATRRIGLILDRLRVSYHFEDRGCGSWTDASNDQLRYALSGADHRELFDQSPQVVERRRKQILIELEYEIENVVAIEERLGLGATVDADVSMSI